jgi:DNA primase
MLRAVVQAARGVSGEAGFAALTEQLRDMGADLDKLVGEVVAEPSVEPEIARRELAGAVRQTTIKILRAEQDQLAASGLADESARTRYREIAVILEQLRAAAERDLSD